MRKIIGSLFQSLDGFVQAPGGPEGDKLSVSQLKLELRIEDNNTQLIRTEQGSYVTGGADAVASREHGTTWHIDNLVASVEGREARAFA